MLRHTIIQIEQALFDKTFASITRPRERYIIPAATWYCLGILFALLVCDQTLAQGIGLYHHGAASCVHVCLSVFTASAYYRIQWLPRHHCSCISTLLYADLTHTASDCTRAWCG